MRVLPLHSSSETASSSNSFHIHPSFACNNTAQQRTHNVIIFFSKPNWARRRGVGVICGNKINQDVSKLFL